MEHEINHQYYISSGAKNNFFTLRLYYQEAQYRMNSYGKYYVEEWRDRDYHVRNLTTKSYEVALEKAREVCKKREWNFVINPEMQEHSTTAIHRLTPEEREIKAMLLARLQRHYDEEREARGFRNAMDTMFDKLRLGKMPYGYYKNWYIHSDNPEVREVCSQGYLFSILRKPESKDLKWQPLNNKVKETILQHYPDMENALHAESNGEYFGEIKKRVKDIKVMLIGEFNFEGYYGITYIQKFLTESGELVIYKGSSPKDFDIGKWETITATVKDHTEYKGEKQTLITRIAWQHDFTHAEVHESMKECIGMHSCKADVRYALTNSFDGLWKYEVPKKMIEFIFKTLNDEEAKEKFFATSISDEFMF